MSQDLLTQLREYGADHHETQQTVRIEEITRPIVEPPPVHATPATVRTIPGWVYAVAAAVIVLLVVGGLGLLFGIGGGVDPATPTTVAPVSPTTVDAPEQSAPETGLIPGRPESVSYIATISFSGSLAREAAVSYLDADTWRMEVTEWFTDVSPPEQSGSRIFVRDGTDMFEYTALSNTFRILDLTNECPPNHSYDDVSGGCANAFYLDLLDPIADGSYPLQFKDFVCDEDGTCVGPGSGETAWADCSVEAGGLVAGLETSYYTCQRDLSLDGVTTQTQTLELWIGADGTTLKWTWIIPMSPDEIPRSPDDRTPGDETITSYEVSEIDQTPNFDPSLFEFECPTENCTDFYAGPDPLAQPMVGQPAPETSGNLLTGETFGLSDVRGQKVIVTLAASWCPPCEDQLIELQTLQERRRDITIIVVLPSDEPATARRFLDQNGIQLLAVDPTQENNTVIRQWQAPGYPTTYLIDENGIIVAGFPGILGQSNLDQLLNDLNW